MSSFVCIAKLRHARMFERPSAPFEVEVYSTGNWIGLIVDREGPVVVLEINIEPKHIAGNAILPESICDLAQL